MLWVTGTVKDGLYHVANFLFRFVCFSSRKI